MQPAQEFTTSGTIARASLKSRTGLMTGCMPCSNKHVRYGTYPVVPLSFRYMEESERDTRTIVPLHPTNPAQ